MSYEEAVSGLIREFAFDGALQQLCPYPIWKGWGHDMASVTFAEEVSGQKWYQVEWYKDASEEQEESVNYLRLLLSPNLKHI